jgi:hypothetical protein
MSQFYEDYRLGHPVHCRLDCDCPSLLRPTRILSCYFPALRTIVRSIYELRRSTLASQDVRKLMKSGSYDELKEAVDALHSILPVNVTSNAEFLPDKLLSVDSLVVLVGGQPRFTFVPSVSSVVSASSVCVVHSACNILLPATSSQVAY